ncbi:hypothetical protein BRC64_09855 [Halobacteriales archaeon QH_10_67_22]|nr:MAG: hypothetical protein BRC64_09855 [Halobacteriales archaeon QH_10_67_22]
MIRNGPEDVAAIVREFAGRHEGATFAQILGHFLLDPDEYAEAVADALNESDSPGVAEQATLGGVAR